MSEQPVGGVRREFQLDLISDGIRRYWYLIVLNAFVMAAVAFVITSSLPKKFTTFAQVELADTPVSTVFGFPSAGDTERALQNQIRIASGEKVFSLAVAKLGYYPKVAIYSAGPNNMLNFVGTSTTAAGAQRDANEVVTAYLKVATDRYRANFTESLTAIDKQSAILRKRLAALPANDTGVAALTTAIRDLEAQRNRVETALQVAAAPVRVNFAASLPIGPDEPQPKRTAGITFVLSMVPATALAALLARYRRGLVDVADLALNPDLVTVEVPALSRGRAGTRLGVAAQEMAIEIDSMSPGVIGALAAFIVLLPSTRSGRAISAVVAALRTHRGDVELVSLSANTRGDGLPATVARWGLDDSGIRHDLDELERTGGSAAIYARFDVGADALRSCEYASSRIVVIERNRTSKALFDRRLRQLETLGLKINAVLVV